MITRMHTDMVSSLRMVKKLTAQLCDGLGLFIEKNYPKQVNGQRYAVIKDNKILFTFVCHYCQEDPCSPLTHIELNVDIDNTAIIIPAQTVDSEIYYVDGVENSWDACSDAGKAAILAAGELTPELAK